MNCVDKTCVNFKFTRFYITEIKKQELLKCACNR